MNVIVLALGSLGLISSSKAASPVQIDVYYESMCPDSASFFSNQLVPTYKKLSDHMTVNLIPYGIASYEGKHDEYTFSCQHGPEECYGNMVQTCYIKLVKITESRIKFINCAFNKRKLKKCVEKCVTDSDLWRQIKNCATGALGRNLQYEMARKTDALKPPKTFIPWITVNGVGGSEINKKVIDNLMGVICDKITADSKPDSCQGKRKGRTTSKDTGNII